jgi:protein-tyrosine phosphatase
MRVQLYSIQGLPAGQVSIMARPRGGDWLIDEVKALREADVDVLVSLLTPDEVVELDLTEEAECCCRQEVFYLSFPIPDFSVPPFSANTFTFLEQLKAHVSGGKHVALHCRQGIGRSSLMAASVLVLTGLSPNQAFEQLSAARGRPVPETEEQRAWVVAFSQYKRSLQADLL